MKRTHSIRYKMLAALLVLSLWACKKGGDPVKISGQAANSGISISGDGRTVFFFEDVEEVRSTSYSSGDLKCFTWGDKSATKISADVVMTTLLSGTRSWLDPKGFLYQKFDSVDKDGRILVNWIFYNGKESVTVAKSVYGGY